MYLLRFMTAGSVDDGKSTLIGRLFYDLGNIHQDHLQNISKNGLNLAHFTDGLKEERERGITIDVAYRYFETAQYKFIVADSPGHKEFTRNMITALTHSDAVVILADASRGITEQTKRHLFLAHWMNTSHIVILINKMDLVNYDENIFNNFKNLLNLYPNLSFIPISALKGENVITSSSEMSWYKGQTLNEWLHSREFTQANHELANFQVQLSKQQDVLGTINHGSIQVGDTLLVNNDSTKICKVKKITQWPKDLTIASKGQAVRITLDQSVERGDVLHSKDYPIRVLADFTAQWCYMLDMEAPFSKSYILKIGTKEIKTKKINPKKQFHLENQQWISLEDSHMTMNSFYEGEIILESSIVVEEKSFFALIDMENGKTIAAGKIIYTGRV
jgi:small GTP-binding protein